MWKPDENPVKSSDSAQLFKMKKNVNIFQNEKTGFEMEMTRV
jgi:hypothetical protein